MNALAQREKGGAMSVGSIVGSPKGMVGGSQKPCCLGCSLRAQRASHDVTAEFDDKNVRGYNIPKCCEGKIVR